MPYLLLVLRTEAFALPITVETSNAEAPREYAYNQPCQHPFGHDKECLLHIQRASTVALPLTVIGVCEVPVRQRTKRQVNAIVIDMCPPSRLPLMAKMPTAG